MILRARRTEQPLRLHEGKPTYIPRQREEPRRARENASWTLQEDGSPEDTRPCAFALEARLFREGLGTGSEAAYDRDPLVGVRADSNRVKLPHPDDNRLATCHRD